MAVLTRFFLQESLWPFCRAAKKSGLNNEVTVLPRWPQGGVPLYWIMWCTSKLKFSSSVLFFQSFKLKLGILIWFTFICYELNRFFGSSLETNITHSSNVTLLPPQPSRPGAVVLPLDLKIGVTSAYAVIFFAALFGNSVGLYVVLKKFSSNSVTNLFIGNMAVADLLLTTTIMPFTVAYLYRGRLWIGGTLGSITCKGFFYVLPVFISASVFTMMLISFDRFYAIFYPLNGKLFRKPKVLSSTIWVLSFGLMTPNVLLFQTRERQPGVYYCLQEWPWAPPNDTDLSETYRMPKIFHICVFVIIYALPLTMTIIINCLICRKLWLRKIPGNVTDTNLAAEKRLKRKVTRLLVITCVVFAVCWFPVYVNHYFRFVRPDQSHKLPFKVQLLFYWIAHANSAFNPCLYILLNKRYRKAFFATLNNFWQFGSSKNTK